MAMELLHRHRSLWLLGCGALFLLSTVSGMSLEAAHTGLGLVGEYLHSIATDDQTGRTFVGGKTFVKVLNSTTFAKIEEHNLSNGGGGAHVINSYVIGRVAYFCVEDPNGIFTLDLDNPNAVPQPRYSAGGQSSWACVPDVEAGYMYVVQKSPDCVGNNGHVVVRIQLDNWTPDQTTGCRFGFQPREGMIGMDTVNHYLYYPILSKYKLERVYTPPTGAMGAQIEELTLNIGNYRGLRIVGDKMFLGTDLGLGLILRTTSIGLSITDVFFTEYGELSSVVIDEVHQVAFWGTSGNADNPPAIIRLNLGGSTVSTTLPLFPPPASTPVQGGSLDLNQLHGFFYNQENEGLTRVWEVELAACFNYTSCGSCLQTDKNYCGWCSDTLQCTSQSQCSAAGWDSSEDNCPILLSNTPSSGSMDGGTSVLITGSNLRLDLSSSCTFNGIPATIGQLINDTSIRCTAPPSLVAGPVNLDVLNQGSPYASNSLTFNYYNCSTTQCKDCFNPARPECSWCLEEVACNSNCVPLYAISGPSSCPAFTVEPSSSPPLNGTAFLELTVSGGTFINDQVDKRQSLDGYSVKVDNDFIDAVRTNDTALVAMLPSSPSGDYLLSLYYKGKQYSDDFATFTFYNCEAEVACHACIAPNKPFCSWCQTSQQCSFEGCFGDVKVLACPDIESIYPTASPLSGTVISLNVSGSFPAQNYTCGFNGPTFTPALFIASTPYNRFECQAPPRLNSGLDNVAIYLNGQVYTNQVSFLYFDCAEQQRCSDCLAEQFFESCSWCLEDATCHLAAEPCNATSIQTGCPGILEISPSSVLLQNVSPLNLTVVGNFFIPNLGYSCLFDNIEKPAMWVSETMLVCSIPFSQELPGVDPSSSLSHVPVVIHLNGAPYTSNSVNLDYYQCFSTWSDCSTCASYPYCGWCVPKGGCLPERSCEASGGIFWLDEECPNITSIEPEYGLIEGGTPIEVQGSFFISDLACQFGNTIVNATVQSDTSLSCVTPASVNAEEVELTIVQGTASDAKDYAVNFVPFTFIDCARHGTCSDCRNDIFSANRCGWCLPLSQCLPAYSCASSWEADACPSISYMNPTQGSLTGGETVVVVGQLFINHPDLRVRFSMPANTSVSAVYVNSTTLTLISPPSSAGFSLVDLILENKEYTENQYPFNFQERDNLSSSGVPSEGLSTALLAIILVLSVFMCFLILAMILGMIMYKRKQSREQIKLIDPRYEEIAFSNWTNPVYDRKQIHEGIDTLEELLIDPEKTLVVALGEITQATEGDNFARCLVYIFEDRAQTLDLMLTFIEIEVTQSNEQTLFRQNSVSTRLFKYYSRMVGVNYLFKTLGRYVAELEAANKREKTDNELISVSIEMEVDPHKLTEGDESNVNTLQLMLVVQKIFNAIMKSIDSIPSPLLAICGRVKNLVQDTFTTPGLEYKAISAFLFLRFICPSLAAPHAYGLLPGPPTPPVQRQLVLLSKVLQNLANGTRFGQKEEFMSRLNDFIDENTLTLHKFYDKMSTMIPDTTQFPPHKIPKFVKENSLIWMHHHIVANKKQLNVELERNEHYDNPIELQTKLAKTLTVLGAPPEKLKK